MKNEPVSIRMLLIPLKRPMPKNAARHEASAAASGGRFGAAPARLVRRLVSSRRAAPLGRQVSIAVKPNLLAFYFAGDRRKEISPSGGPGGNPGFLGRRSAAQPARPIGFRCAGCRERLLTPV